MQALQRQAVCRVNTRDAQDAGMDAIVFGPGADAQFGIDAAQCARRLRLEWLCFADLRAVAISVYAAGADIDEVFGWCAVRQGGEQIAGAGVALPGIRRGREMQYGVGDAAEAHEAAATIKIADDRRDACVAQAGALGAVAHQAKQAIALPQQWRDTQCNVPTSDNENAFHPVIMR